ncbi:MAG: transcription antitermination factor NusB [Aestuariivirgaceae bacterium]
MATKGRKAGRPSGPPGLEARRDAVLAVAAVLREGRPLDLVLAAASRDDAGDSRDRALTRVIVATTLRRLGEIERVLGRFLERPLPRKSGRAREILLTGAAQLLFLRTPPHAVIDLAVRLAGAQLESRHLGGLVNAVLRKVAAGGEDLLSGIDAAIVNTPAWLMERWRAAFGSDTARAIAASHMVEPPLDLTARDPAAVAAELGGVVLPSGTVRLAAARGRIEDLPGYRQGGWWVQDAAAALPARLLGNVRDLRIADLCAAPGGKTAQLAADGAAVTAVERSAARLERLEANLQRLQLTAETVCSDATEWQPSEPFDAVLLDAPCSATGTIRRNPDVPHIKTPAMIAALVPLQAQLIRRAIDMVRPGGLVVYATCSLEEEECGQQIEALLAERRDVARQPISAAELGIDRSMISEAGDLRTLPIHGMDGFYAARLRKR